MCIRDRSVIRAPAESMNQKIGSSSRNAIPLARIIFSTVRAPHDPALTVGSLATTTAGRPSTVPLPVTTPSAGRSPEIELAKRPSSTKEPSSNSNEIRSRTYSLFCEMSLAAAFGGGVAEAVSYTHLRAHETVLDLV